MKKLWVTLFLFIFILSACHSSQLSFSEVENVSSEVQEEIDADLKLQLLNVDEKSYYIIFQSNGDVETDLEAQDDTLTVKLDELNLEDGSKIQNVYYLTTDRNHDVIDVLVNGESTPFDEVK